MPVIYADEAQRMGVGVSGLPEVVKGLATTVGLRDPISVYEPNVPLPQVWEKYSAMVAAFRPRVNQLRAKSSVRKGLLLEVSALESQRNRLGRAFAAGAQWGSADRSSLGDMVQGARNFRRSLWAAEKKYGTNAPPAATEEGITSGGGTGIMPIVLIGAGLFAVAKIARLF